MMNTKRLVAAFLCLLIPFVTMSVSAKDSGYKVIYDGGSLGALKTGTHVRLNFDDSSLASSFLRRPSRGSRLVPRPVPG